MDESFQNPLTARIAAFLESIGLPVRAAAVPERTFLPGLHIAGGTLLVDESHLIYPGDILHEAGHLAVMTPAQRASLEGDVGDNGGEEMAAIAWSYAAAVHLGIPPEVVFHEAGYRGGAANLIENFAQGRSIGLPYLKWIGLAGDDYPSMRRWLRE
ncbi:MAG: hypothetical protein JST11_07980 [Acidobacteria bacterium]|nr:hypothetical protein [Acidobacteriota bacterium]